jgi:hypothetical protein
MGKNRAALNGFGQRQFALRRLARGPVLALAVVTAPLVAAGQAQAAFNPATTAGTPLINNNVSSTGATAGQNGTTRYGVSQDKGNTITVQSGASVTGTDTGIRTTGSGNFPDADTISNFGTISGTNTGIFGSSGIVNNQAGATISSSAGAGIFILSQGAVTNSGTISGTGVGVDVQNGTVTNTLGGTISGGINGAVIEDDGLQTGGNATISNAGTVTGGTHGLFFRRVGSHPADLINSGLISAPFSMLLGP